MSDVSMHASDVQEKAAEQARIDAQKAAFFARGGKIERVGSEHIEADAGRMKRIVEIEEVRNKKRRAGAAAGAARRRRKEPIA